MDSLMDLLYSNITFDRDRTRWMSNSNGKLTVCSYYDKLRGVCRTHFPKRIAFFVGICCCIVPFCMICGYLCCLHMGFIG